jgi:methionyl-tRNA formyltransferase
MRLLLAGTPAVALPSLDAITASGHQLAGVLTRPDTVAGRGRHPSRSPVALWADERGLPVLQPAKLAAPESLQALRALAPDCVAVVAYGALIRPDALAVPPHGWVNLHFSLLPAWRGAAPVQHALIAGDELTGATTFRLDEGLDTGPVYGVLTERVRPTDTAGDLLGRLAEAGAGLLVATLDGIADGTLEARPQSADGVSLAPKLTAEDARLDWTHPAVAVDRRIRGCTPEPGAWTLWRGGRLGIAPFGRPGAAAPASLQPGQLLAGKREVWVGTGTTPVLLGQVRPAGRRPMAAADWARGVRPQDGERFGEPR